MPERSRALSARAASLLLALAAGLMLLLLPAAPTEAQTAGVTVSKTSLAIAAGGTATYTVALDTAPTANVTIAVASGTTAAATVSPATLTFTSSDHAAKTVTVTGVAAGWSSITHAATSTDTNYSSISIGSVAVRVDAAGTGVLVGNVGQDSLPGGFLVKTSNAFTTGSNAGGYTLTSVGLPLGQTSGGTIDVDLHSDSSGDPGTKIADLTAPTSLHDGVVYFAAPSSTPTLTASTVYHLVINGSNLDFHTTGSDNEDSGGAAGWSIANISQTYDTTNSVWVDDQFDASISFQIRGAAGQTQSTDATLSALTGSTSTDGSTFGGTLTLDPAFAAATEDYIATVPNNVTHMKVTPTANESNATIEAGKGSTLTAVTSAMASTAIALTVGANEINVKVTAQDMTTTKTYTIVVTRAATDTLVSNVGQATGSGGYRPSDEYVTAFTTGSNAAGYTLTGIHFHIATKTASLTDAHLGTLTASVWTSGGAALTTGLDDLGTKLADLTVPATAASVTTGPVTFAAPTGTTLAASTTYYVVIGSSAWTGGVNLLLSGTESDDEDAGAADGFSIANTGNTYTGNQFVPWTEIGTSEVLSFRVSGSARAGTTTPTAPTALSADAGSGSLALSWTAPAGTPTGYDVHYTYAPTTGTGMVANNAAASGNNAATAWVAATRGTETSPPTASQTLSSLDNGRTYRWRVRGVNSNGNGAWAFGTGTPVYALSWPGAAAFITEGDPYSQRIQTQTQVAISGTLTYAAGDTNPASLTADLGTYPTTFSANAGAVYTNMPDIPTVDDTVNEENETFKVTINAGTGYTVGTRPTITITIDDNDPPAAPSGLSLTAGAQKLSASWTKPAGPVSSYRLRYKTTTATDQTATTAGDPSTGWVTTTASITTTMAEITMLTNGTAYHVQVSANDGQTTSGNGWGDWSSSVTGTPTATPTAGVTVSTTSVSVVAGSTTTYTIKLNKAPTADVTVTPTSGDTDKATVTNQAKTFTSTNWSQTQTVTVTGVTAGTSTITHAATSTDTDYQGISIASVAATVTAATQTAPTTLALSTNAASNTIAEDGGSVTVTATLNRAATTAVSVTLTATGTATGTADYSLPAAFTIPVGQTSATGTVSIVDDDIDEANETVILTTSVSGLTVTGVTLTITDDDTAGVSVSQTSRSVEVGATTTYTVVLDSKPTANVVVGATSGTPANATVAPASRTFTPQNWDTAQTFTITGVQVGSSTITHAATSTDTNYPSTLSIGSVTASVVASSKTFRIESTKTANEGANARLTVTLGQAAPTGGLALAVTYDYSGSTATADDTGTTPATLTIAAGQTTGTLTIPIAQDALVEGDETFTATISTSVSGWAKVSGEDEATITIADDDDNNASVSFRSITATTKQTFSVTENVSGGTLRVPIVITDNPSVDTTFNVTVETGGTATEWTNTQNPGDFRIQTKSVTFGPTTSRIQHLTITITNDALLEENQTIELKISDSTSGTIGALYTRHAMGRLAKVTITDDERTGARVAFGTNPASTSNHTASVDEDVTGNTLNVPVTINRIPESSITIPVTVLTASTHPASEWQSAQNLGDFRIVTKSVTFGPSDTLSSGTVSKNLAITINDDDLVEEDQRILVSIGDSATNNLGRHYTRHSSGRRAVLTIEDDEADEAKIAFAIPDLGIPGIPFQGAGSRAEYKGDGAENEASGYWEASVLVSAKPESDITIPITVVSTGTTATSADYTIATSSVTFGPNRPTQQLMRITIVNDDLVEEDQTIKLRLAAAGSGLDRFYARDTEEQDDTDGVSTEATVTILDDERDDAKIAFGANASGTSSYTATVDEDVTGGVLNVPVTINHLPESNTQFTVEVLAASTATEWTNAQNPGDYRVLNNKAVTFRPTDTGKTQNVQIRLTNNALVEHPETVQLRIVAADTTPNDLGDHYDRNAQSRLATLTINDDDAAAATIAIGTNAASMTKFTHSVDEDVTNGTYKIPIKVSHSPSVDTTFELQVLGTGTATGSGTDYSIATRTFTLTPTTTSATVDVTITDDAWVEDDQTIEVRIKAANTSGTTLEKYYTRHASGSLGQITIEDDEQRDADIAFGTAARTTRYTADGEEVVGTLNVPIAINHLPESNTTFTVEVLSTSTARETDDPNNATGNPKDFVIGTKTVTFGAATAKSMNLAIAIENDDVEEDDEYLDLRIVAKDTTVDDLGDHYDRGGSEATVGAGATARVTVKSEDEVSSVKFTTNITGTAGVQGGDILLFEGQELVVTATADKYVGPGGWKVALALRGWRSSITASPNDVTLPTFTIPEGAKTATGTITIVTDTSTEQQELFHFGGNAKRKSRTVQATPTWTRARITDSGAGLTLSTTTLDLLPTEELTYTVRLNQAPTANVTVTPASSATGKATVSSALTFTSTNWETPQPVTVTGVAAGSATITHTVTSTDTAYTNLSNLPRLTARVTAAATTFALLVKESGLSTATAEEGDTVVLELTADTIAPSGGTQFNAVWTETPDPIVGTVGVTASHTALTVTASGAGNTSTYTVRLNTQPTASVTITPTSGAPANATVSPASRTFTTSNWATPQEFTVTGVLAGSSTITHAVTSTDTSYDGATIDDVTVTVAASAVTPGGLTLSTNAPMNRVNEGGSLLVIARLNQAAPTGGTTVTLTVDSASTAETTDYNLPTTISIAAGKTTGSVTLTTQQDNDPDNETIVLTVAATSPTLSGTGLTVTIVDDERGVTVTVPEGKRRVDASIRLPDDSTPSVGVKRITVRGSGPSMWTARSGKGSVRISYTDDDGGMATVAFGNNAARNNAYQATVMEDVTGGTLTVPVTVSADVDEAMTFTVRVLPDSTAREASSCPATPTATQDFRIANKTVTIAAGQTSTNLTIQICNDAFGEPDETIRLGFTPAPATARNVEDLFQRRPAGNLQAVITIDSEDVPTSVRLAAGAFQDATANEGGQVEMRATLDRPADQGGVTVTLTLKSGVASTATSADYRLPVAFTIPAGETSATAVVRLLPDEVVDGEKVLRLTATTSPSLTVTFATPPNPDLATNVLLNRQYVEIVIRDADSPGLNLSRSSLTVAAGQQAEPYTVRLNSRPTATVTVALTSDDESLATVSPATLTFTTQNWRAPQEVRVRARARGAVTITHALTSTDTVYGAIGDVPLTVTVSPRAPVGGGGLPGGGGGGGGGGGAGGGGAVGGGGGGGGPSPSEVDFEWTVERDVEELAPAHDRPAGMQGEGSTVWLLQNGTGADDAVYVYDLETKERDAGREFALDERNRAPRGIAIADEIAWVSDSGQDRLFAYDTVSGERLAERDVELAPRNRDARGLWIGEGVAWVLDAGKNTLFAYDLATGALLGEYALDPANGDPRGVWSDGVTIWVSDHGAKQLFAYRLPARPPDDESAEPDATEPGTAEATQAAAARPTTLEGGAAPGEVLALQAGPDEPVPLERVRDEEFEEPGRVGNNSPRGIWSDGEFMYVADELDGKVYSYNMPDAIDARLVSLSLEGVDFGEFSPARTEYEGAAAEGVTVTVVTAEAAQRRTTVVIDPPDADPDTAGHQVALDGLEALTVTVTSQDGSRVRVYRVVLGAPDALLASLSLEGVDFGEFSPVRTEYEGAAAEGVTVTTVEAEAAQPGTTVAVDPPDADPDTAGHQVALDDLEAVTVTVTSQDGTVTRVYRVVLGAPQPQPEPWAHCLKGAVVAGFSLLVYEGGTVDELAACAQSRGVTALYALHEGQYLAYIPEAPDFVNEPFAELFAEGVPSLTPLVAASDGPSADPVGALPAPTDWPGCLRGEVAAGWSLVLHEGGSVAALAECAREHALSSAWALHEGEWIAYAVGAPDFVNRPFAEIFTDGLPPLTPLVVRSDAPPNASSGGN